jgi:hypothetical protein
LNLRQCSTSFPHASLSVWVDTYCHVFAALPQLKAALVTPRATYFAPYFANTLSQTTWNCFS